VSVTLRMPSSMIDALKAEAQRRGVRGYQTLMKQWIDERLAGEPSVSASQLAAVMERLRAAHQDLASLIEERDDAST
jgi:hypothetical protein